MLIPLSVGELGLNIHIASMHTMFLLFALSHCKANSLALRSQ